MPLASKWSMTVHEVFRRNQYLTRADNHRCSCQVEIGHLEIEGDKYGAKCKIWRQKERFVELIELRLEDGSNNANLQPAKKRHLYAQNPGAAVQLNLVYPL